MKITCPICKSVIDTEDMDDELKCDACGKPILKPGVDPRGCYWYTPDGKRICGKCHRVKRKKRARKDFNGV